MISTRFIKYLLISSFALTVISCKKGNKQDAVSSADIYIAGAFPGLAGNISSVGYWKNGVEVKLNDSLSGLTNAIVVKGTDIYAAGYIYSPGSGYYGAGGNGSQNQQSPPTGTYWRNGIAVTVGTNTVCTAIAVSGSDVYVAGYSYMPAANNNGGFVQSPATANMNGMYWKNGTPVSLGPNTICTAIAVIGSDVYVAGAANNSAAYWKNGVLISLPGNVFGSVANAIASNGGDIYFAGTVYTSATNSYAVYWKNGIITRFAEAASTGNAIVVNNGNLYIAGTSGINAAFWKNGAITLLKDPNIETSGARGIAVNGSTVYVAGFVSLAAVYWQNGTPDQLSFSGTGNGIAVVPK